jgi:SAM-dependent methyltransferase
MIASPPCPICHSNDWKVFARKDYVRRALPDNSYDAIRQDVLFDLWFAGAEEIRLQSIGCTRCGFFCYSPRPDEQDLAQKYAYINNHESGSKEIYTPRASDKARARDLFTYTQALLQTTPARIIDYGGGDGRLLGKFVEQGHDCSVIDFTNKTIPGVTYAGTDPLQVQTGHYDLVTCSHVIEHIAEPVATLQHLKELLADSGHIYIEVPSEIWIKAPPKIDPVTHINFFTRDSLHTLMTKAGLDVVSCRYHAFTRPNGLIGIAVKGIARKPDTGQETRAHAYFGLREVERMLSTSLWDRFLRIARHPRMLRNLLPKGTKAKTP